MKLAAICDKDTAIGLRLAGVHEVHVERKKTLLSFGMKSQVKMILE